MNPIVPPAPAAQEGDLTEQEIAALMQQEPPLRRAIDFTKDNILPAATKAALLPLALAQSIRPSHQSVTIT